MGQQDSDYDDDDAIMNIDLDGDDDIFSDDGEDPLFMGNNDDDSNDPRIDRDF